MEQIELIEPDMKYADDIWKFRREIMECDAENEDKFAGCLSLDVSKSAAEWIRICELRKSEETCGEAGTSVPSHMYLAVRKKDDKIVGVIDLRHHINHPILGTWGGHCGYSVRPSERGKGYAKEMLRLNILNAKALGIPKLLITCDVKNEASEKTILANGGVYESTIDVDGCKMKRYWITVLNSDLVVPFTNNMDAYLKEDAVIDYSNESITQLTDTLLKKANNELEFIQLAYEFVRDNIFHSADINEDIITCTASEVLNVGHGICFAKSHLLAAILRCKSIPTGFCYQKLILDDETAPVLIYHGLNGVYIKELHKWVRLDARGNKNGVNAQFSIETEQLTFSVRAEKGEEDGLMVYPNPDAKILERLKKYKTRTELWDDLPTELGYNL